MRKDPTRKTDVWGTLVSVLAGYLLKWYPLIDASRWEVGEREHVGHPPPGHEHHVSLP